MEVGDWQSAFIPRDTELKFIVSFLLFAFSIPPGNLRPWAFLSLSLFLSWLPFAYFVILSIYSSSPTKILIRTLFISYTVI